MPLRLLLPMLLTVLLHWSCSPTGLTPGRSQTQTRPAASQPAAASQPSPKLPTELTLDLGGGVTMKLVLIPAGNFLMGSPVGEKGHLENEGPQHAVRIDKPFYMGIYTVTQGQWRHIMGTTVSQQYDKKKEVWGMAGEGDDLPMYYITWEEAGEFCRKLSQKTGRTVRLPTEAQWQYACRAGSVTRYYYGFDEGYSEFSQYAWGLANSYRQTHPVGQKKPNAWGLYDMHGNVCQWCSDRYEKNYTVRESVMIDPSGPAEGELRTIVGGCWDTPADQCRSTFRLGRHPLYRDCYIGLRVVVEAK